MLQSNKIYAIISMRHGFGATAKSSKSSGLCVKKLNRPWEPLIPWAVRFVTSYVYNPLYCVARR